MDKSGSIKNGFVPFVPYGYIDISSKIKKGDEKTNEDSTSDGGLIELEGSKYEVVLEQHPTPVGHLDPE